MVKHFDAEPEKINIDNFRSQLSLRYGYSNMTSHNVSIIRRDGTVNVIPPSIVASRERGRFEIMYSVEATRAVIETVHLDNCTTMQERRVYEQLLKRGHKQGNIYSLKYAVPAADLIDGEGVFIEALDIVVSTKPLGKTPKHPYSASSSVKDFMDGMDEDIFTYRMAMVNKLKTVGDLYVKICGNVIKIPQINKEGLPDGIYIAFGVGEEVKLSHYAFNDDDKPFGVFRTKYEAETLGGELNAELEKLAKQRAIVEENIARWEHEHQMLKNNLESNIKRMEYDSKILNNALDDYVKMNEAQRKLVEHQSKISETELKNNADLQATTRKNSTEWMKSIPHILGTVAAAATLFTGA